MYRSSKFYAIHTDHLGTPRLVTDNTNQPVWQWAYSAFGDNAPSGILKPTTNAASAYLSLPPTAGSGTTTATLLAVSAPAQVFNLRFPGQYSDSETGWFYNTMRSYLPTQDRYGQNDPIGLGGGWNRSVYANANALRYTDPLGLATDEEIRKAVATLRCANPGEFNKLAKSISMANMGENGAGMTDWGNNITLNSRLYGDSNTPVIDMIRSEFLQTTAHEMLHVNQSVGGRVLSKIRMGNPLGVLHRQLDAKAESMITRQLLDQYNRALQSGDTGCSCTR